MPKNTENATSDPWYTYPMVWLVIAIPLTAVVLGLSLAYLAATTFDGMVVDDYYKRGQEINMVLKRDHFATEYDVIADVAIDTELGVVSVAMSSVKPYEFPDALGLAFLHPTRANHDHKLLLEKGPDGRYFVDLNEPLTDGEWHIRLSDKNWKLQRRFQWPNRSQFRVKPVY